MTGLSELKKRLSAIVAETVEARWDEIAPFVRAALLENLAAQDQYYIDRAIRGAVEDAFNAALEHHARDTYRDALDRLAQAKVKQNIAARFKRRGITPPDSLL